MKIDRLIAILSILQKGALVTAPQLAERLEVSRRTINRDIDDLCRAGIPIVTTQGMGGGIALMEGCCVDTTLFTAPELRALLAGIRSLDSVSASPRAAILAGKLSPGGQIFASAGDIVIDLASFYKGSLTEKITLLEHAIREHRAVRFHYYYRKGESDVLTEPCRLCFKWSAWYLQAYTPARGDFRLYKLLRLWDLQETEEYFVPREIPEEQESLSDRITDEYQVTGLFTQAVKYRLVDEYGPESFTVQPDGRLLFTRSFQHREDAALWFLSFGDQAEAIAPIELRKEIARLAAKILSCYP